jgi:hypothetical protein
MSFRSANRPPVSSLQVEGWLGQLERLRRWHQRLQELRAKRLAGLAVADLDLTLVFFQTAYHLRDWILNDGAPSRGELDELMSGSLALKVCRDLCLGSKHLLVRVEKASADPHASVVREYVPGPSWTRGPAVPVS